MTTSPLFSVVMPAYNTADTIADAISSVLAQNCSDLELIVVDDGSTDSTSPVVKSFADPRLRLLAGENCGAAAARNIGIAESCGHFVSFIDSDDLWMPTYLECMRASLQKSDHAGFAYTDAWKLDSRTRRIGTATAMQWQHPPVPPPADANAFLLELLERNFVYNAVTVPRDLFGKIGSFRENLHAAIDYEMWLRLAANGFPGIRPDGIHAVYRRGRPGSISTNRRTVLRSLLEVYRLVAEEYAVSPMARTIALRRAAETQAELSALEGELSVRALWLAHLRPALVSVRNVLLRRDRWRAEPPHEVAQTFPALVGPLDRST